MAKNKNSASSDSSSSSSSSSSDGSSSSSSDSSSDSSSSDSENEIEEVENEEMQSKQNEEREKEIEEKKTNELKEQIVAMHEASKSGRTGGVYIPPFKLAQMKAQMEAMEKTSKEYQRLTWGELRKSINGLINKVSVGNIRDIIPKIFKINLIRGRGLMCRSLMKAQLASPGFSHIYSALVAVINTKLPENGELVVKRVIHSFRRAYKRRDKIVATGLVKFIAHLVNQRVANELLALQLILVLLEDPTDDSVEIAVNFTKEVGQVSRIFIFTSF